MIGQPTVNDLASVFRGNPGPLQARVNQDMQGQPPGALPKDLSDLLALQIVTNEQDAAKRNAAMQQLQQMQGPQGQQGEPPTIAQSLQQQAKQKLQAQMMQQMRQQQGLQALAQQAPMGAIPEHTPQPEEQPEAQGLDMLPSNVGENYAGGGIIAFNGEEGSDVPEARDNRKVYPGMLPMEGGTVLPERSGLEGMTMGDLVSLLRDKARRYFSPEREAENAAAMYANQRPPVDQSMANARDILLAQGRASNLTAAPMGEKRVGGMTLDQALQGARAQDEKSGITRTPQEQAEVDATIRRRFAGAEPDRVTPTPPVAVQPPIKKGLPAAVTPPAPPAAPAAPVMSDREKFLAAQFGKTPDAGAAEAEYETKVGQRPTADLAALADEIAARRQALRSRADPMMDFLRGVAMAPRGEKWMQSGVRGGMYADELRAAREAQDMELLQKLMETKGKITDIEYGYKKEKYGVGKDAAAKAYDRTFKAAELMGYDERAAKELAFKAAESVKDRENELKKARIMADARAAGTGEKQTLNELRALQASIRDQLKDPRMMGPRGDALRAQLQQINAAIARMAGIDTMPGAPSAPSPGGNRPPLSSFQR